MNTLEMTENDFRVVRQRENDEDIGLFDSLVIIPARTNRDLHESGYRYIGYVAVFKNEPICFLSGGSDVLHIDGIGGAGRDSDYTSRKPKAWNIDCLPKSGLLNLFCSGHKLYVRDYAYSSFEIFAARETDNDKNVEAEVAKKADYIVTKLRTRTLTITPL